MKSAISPTRDEDYPEWYLQVVKAAGLAEHSPVRGCMVILPWGYGIWENIQKELNARFKDEGVQNAYFPLLIPLEYFQKEARHVDGFATECAVVTHSRLEKDAKGNLVPAGKLEAPLIIRPTSEMIIAEMFSKWIESYRDLPIKLNQWANIVRWEMRTRMFLRTAEFLWQEGHTAYASAKEAREDAERMLAIYAAFMEKHLAMAPICGVKTAAERFPGADDTYCLEAMMQDKKALQAGTTHYLGQNFSKASNIKFVNEKGSIEQAYTASWGVTTRLIGGLVMTHSDDDGLILPPKIASYQIVILPVIHNADVKETVLDYCRALKRDLAGIADVLIDERDMRGGEKKWHWVKKGIPVRVEIGMRDIEGNLLCVAKRNRPAGQVDKQSREQFLNTIAEQLDQIQEDLYQKALAFRKLHSRYIDDKEAFYRFFKEEGGFAFCHWSGDEAVEAQLKKELGITVRCIPFDEPKEKGRCIFTGKSSPQRVVFAKSY